MKVPKPKKQKSGNYTLQLRLGGESICITRATAVECTIEAQTIKSDYLAGRRKIVKKAIREMTLEELLNGYIEKNKAVLSPSTVHGYNQYASCRFSGYLKKQIKNINWQNMINDELKEVSPKTVKNAWGLVHAALKASGYPLPDVRLAQVPVPEIDFLQPDEIGPFCEYLKGRSYEIAALLMLHSLRQSEVRALTWDNIDLKRKTITVSGAVVKGPDGMTAKKTNKNKTSTRILPILIPQLENALNAVQDKQGKVVNICGSCLLRDVHRASKAAVGRELSAHSLRHSFASLLYFLGIPDRQIQEWGGWAVDETLHRIYIRLTAAGRSQATDKVRSFFSENQNAKMKC